MQTQDCWLEGESGDRFELAAIVPVATARGYGFTVLGKSYEAYDRQLFEDTLNDWQWTGDGDPPPWYTGAPWSE